jgi:hypothetical protein
LFSALQCAASGAVCLDPKTGISGYKLPLNAEVRDTPVIVIGRILSETPLREDPTDPDGFTAYKTKIKVLNRLKGSAPSVIVIRNENTSARYAMSVDEEHLLFISSHDQELRINTCGNSSPKRDADRLEEQIKAQLRSSK